MMVSVQEAYPPHHGVAAVIVAYLPSSGQLNRLVHTLVSECRVVFIMDNGGVSQVIDNQLLLSAGVRHVDMHGNRGIGAALNHGFELARVFGVSYVLTFDQDSDPSEGMVSSLVTALESASREGIAVAAVGPRVVDFRHGSRTEHPFMRSRGWLPSVANCSQGREYVETDLLITSGCLVSLAAYDQIGAFDAGMFVDCTDMEWGFRALTRGFRLLGVCSTIMSHELGTGDSNRVLGLTILGHSPVRRYYYARNSIRILKLPYVSIGWKLHIAIGLIGRAVLLPFATKSKIGSKGEWKMFVIGVWDGLRGVNGPIASG